MLCHFYLVISWKWFRIAMLPQAANVALCTLSIIDHKADSNVFMFSTYELALIKLATL